MNNSTFEEQLAVAGKLIYTNKGDSMMPLIKQDRDLVIIEPVHGRLKRYDVPLYKRDSGQYVLHRIMKVRKDDYVMCGDNRWSKEYGMLAHEYKHFSGTGTGVRSLVDTYVFLQKFNDTLDWDYIKGELNKLGISDFERQNRELAMKFFEPDTLTEEERNLLDYYIFSGTYGTLQQSFEHKIQRNADGKKSKYIFQRLFPSMDQINACYPFFYRHKWLIPILWIYRPFKGLYTNRKKLLAEFRYLRKSK